MGQLVSKSSRPALCGLLLTTGGSLLLAGFAARSPVIKRILRWTIFLLLIAGVPIGGMLAKHYLDDPESVNVDRLGSVGNSHKLHQRWLEAGKSFEAAAELFSKQRRCEHETANSFAEAANCYRKLKQKEFIDKAVKCLERAATIYAEMGQFSIAARHLEEAGDLVANGDEARRSKAIELYQKAGDFWSGEDSPASAAGSRSKAANLLADIGKLDDAAREFEELALSSQQHSLLGFGTKDHMLRCCLCLLCTDAAGFCEKMQHLLSQCESFAESDEHSLVMKLSAACDSHDTGAFDSAVTEFERFNNVDDWLRRRLKEIRRLYAGENPTLM